MLDIDYAYEDLIALVVIDFVRLRFFESVRRCLDLLQVIYLLVRQNLEL